ncbi:MAG: hypothetical protein HUU45_15140, partial [Leptospiraceae bacterium]|nr:hypothetical protein [Leptospiraceae bacterium]
MNRISSFIYPDGTKLNYVYSDSGHLTGITMDSSDGQSIGHTVVSYHGPTANGSLVRKTGNGAETEIFYNPANLRPTGFKTKLPDGSIRQDIVYGYDNAGNITAITDRIYENRTESFTYDNQSRLRSASGIYGHESYEYTHGGDLRKKGSTSFQYGDLSHVNAVTLANTVSGPIYYGYDESGNMVSRNGESMRYDSFGRLFNIQSPDGRD